MPEVKISKKQAGKGGGARKYGRNRSKTLAYASRASRGETPKCRRVAAEMLKRAHGSVSKARKLMDYPIRDWALREDGKAVRTRKARMK